MFCGTVNCLCVNKDYFEQGFNPTLLHLPNSELVSHNWLKLFIKQLVLSFCIKYSFSQRTIHEWNRLSTDSVNASCVNM